MAERERYSIVKRLDKGGMAEVFLGKSTSLEGFDKIVAIKRVLPDLARNDRFVNMFLDEAKISLHLDHANIVSVFDVGRSGASYFIVMEYIDGTNMKRIVDGRSIPVDLACYIAIEVCKGLVYAHEKLNSKGQPQQIVHRDISPPNILISRDGEVKLTDFGLARAASQLESTDPGVVKGKFAYLSPEASMGEEVDLRTDIFALGIVLWESLAGRRLFQGQTDLETLNNVRACEVPSIHSIRHDIPASLDRILNRALAKDPADRYGSARDFGRELSRFLVQQGMSVTSYDLAAWIQERMDLPAEVSKLSPSLVENAVQQELERFVAVDDSSVAFSATNSRISRVGSEGSGTFEDPRLWGFSEESDKDGGGDAFPSAHTPSGPVRLRRGTEKLGKPLSEEEVSHDSSVRHSLPGYVPRSLPPLNAKIDESESRTLPGFTRSNEPSNPASRKKVVPKRTMMMAPIDTAFFDALETASASKAEAPPLPPRAKTSSSVPEHSQTPSPIKASVKIAKPQRKSQPLSTKSADTREASSAGPPPTLPPVHTTGSRPAVPTPPLSSPRQEQETKIVAAAPSAFARPFSSGDFERAPAKMTERPAWPSTTPTPSENVPVIDRVVVPSKASIQKSAQQRTPESVITSGVATVAYPWFAQLLVVGALAAIGYFSYLILGEVVGL